MSGDAAAVLVEAFAGHLDHDARNCAICGAAVSKQLAALAAAGYAIVRLPEGVAVAHGARLVGVGRGDQGLPVYLIKPSEATP